MDHPIIRSLRSALIRWLVRPLTQQTIVFPQFPRSFENHCALAEDLAAAEADAETKIFVAEFEDATLIWR